MKKVAVVYLARIYHGINAFKPFVDSYRKFDSGYPHELILLGKGVQKKGERAGIHSLFDGVPHRLIEVSDAGFDIHAYLNIAETLDHEYIFFCNTYTEFLTENWLAKLMCQIELPNVGLVGTSASYESLYESTKLIQKLNWLTGSKRIKFDEKLAEQFRVWLNVIQPMSASPFYSLYKRMRRFVGDIVRRRIPYTKNIDAEFESVWNQATRKGEPLSWVMGFAKFPNPHIRSTSFLISRDLFLSFKIKLPDTKVACALFESGYDSLSNRVKGLGLDILLVGANGIGYLASDWFKSKTFRLDSQVNCITADNHIRAYENFDFNARYLHDRMTWGDYLSHARADFISLGVEFKKSQMLFMESKLPIKGLADTFFRYSIVIPTHNRLSLLKDSVATVLGQSYQNWELVIFDNASSEGLEDYVKKLNDSRIVFKRSEKFLAVTESWNCAIEMATGDYVILIGDDDGLIPEALERISLLLNAFDKPDVVYAPLLQFFHPGVAPWQPEGYVTKVFNGAFFVDMDGPFLLDKSKRIKSVEGSMQIRRSFTFNMQAFVFKRLFLDTIKVEGEVFKSPFPDYYLANIVFVLAKTFLVAPEPLAIQGVSKPSFGYTLLNKLESKGNKLLNTNLDNDFAFNSLKNVLLSGPTYNTNYIITMEHVYQVIRNYTNVKPDFKRYRKMQLMALTLDDSVGVKPTRGFFGDDTWSHIKITEKFFVLMLNLCQRYPIFFSRLLSVIKRNLNQTEFAAVISPINIGDFETTVDLFDAIQWEGDVVLVNV